VRVARRAGARVDAYADWVAISEQRQRDRVWRNRRPV
jgi:hypothetical protein